MNMETEITNNTTFVVKENKSGIDISNFSVGDIKYEVDEVLAYVPWNFGKINLGTGQVGVYKTKGSFPKFAILKDYRSSEGNWKVIFVYLAEDEKILEMIDSIYGLNLR